MQKTNPEENINKQQSQPYPGLDSKMDPQPEFDNGRAGSHKLEGKKCIITGGDSGIGRAVAVSFAKEGADVAIMYLEAEQKDADDTKKYIEENFERKCITIAVDLINEKNCIEAIKQVTKSFKRIDVLVNNAGVHFPAESIEDINEEQLKDTFAVNIFAMFWLVKAALPFMNEGSNIINTASVTAYRGSGQLLDYSSTKGAIVSFTRSLSASLVHKKIRVNGIAPGPIWTPLIVSTLGKERVATFGSDTPMGRPGQPYEVAAAFLFLASDDASYITGQIIHVNGGEIING